jgi:hypothetical protein
MDAVDSTLALAPPRVDVALEHGVDRQQSEAGIVEDVFDDDHAPEQRGELHAEQVEEGIAIVTSAIFVLINILVDLAATTIDPRLEY